VAKYANVTAQAMSSQASGALTVQPPPANPGETYICVVAYNNDSGSGDASANIALNASSGNWTRESTKYTAGSSIGAFPQATVVDSFTRADAATLGTGWSAGGDLSGGSPRIVSNVARVQASGVWSSVLRTASLGADQEAFATISTLSTGWEAGIYMRISGGAGYVIQATPTALNLRTTGGYIQGASTTWAVGDKWGARIVGSTITLMKYTAASSSWATLLTRTDSTYTAGGQVGFYLSDVDGTTIGTLAIDDFAAVELTAGGGAALGTAVFQHRVGLADVNPTVQFTGSARSVGYVCTKVVQTPTPHPRSA
jgi:hypothetical protein